MNGEIMSQITTASPAFASSTRSQNRANLRALRQSPAPATMPAYITKNVMTSKNPTTGE